MSADTGGMGIGGDDGLAERMLVALCRGEVPGLAGSGQSEASHNVGRVLLRYARPIQALMRRIDGRGKTSAYAEAQIRRAGFGFGQDFPRGVAKPRPATRAAAVDAQKQEAPYPCASMAFRIKGCSAKSIFPM